MGDFITIGLFASRNINCFILTIRIIKKLWLGGSLSDDFIEAKNRCALIARIIPFNTPLLNSKKFSQ